MLEVAGVARSATEFVAQSTAPGLRSRAPRLASALRSRSSPVRHEADLLSEAATGLPFAYGGGRWRCFPVAEFHETNEAYLWEGATTGPPLWKGESFDQFDPHGAEARFCPATDERSC